MKKAFVYGVAVEGDSFTERVAARLGGGGLDAMYHAIDSNDTLQAKADELFSQSLGQVRNRILYENDLDCIMNNEFAIDLFEKKPEGIPYQMQAGVDLNHDQFKDMILSMLVDHNNGHENEVYFYHSDHLGSASWITDSGGVAIQHLQYLPYGEQYVDQRISGYHERFTFTGKEKDEETGYGYFGARYMDHELMTMWLSVDPMVDKYPSISPYAYCVWNPVRAVDPDGREIWIYNYDGKGNSVRYRPGMNPTGTKAAQAQIISMNRMTQTSSGWKLILNLTKSTKRFYISNASTGTEQTCATVAKGDGSVSKMGGHNDIRSISHELFHAYQFCKGQGGATYYNEVEAYVFSEIVTNQYYDLPGAEGLDRGESAFLSSNPNSIEGRKYANAMEKLKHGFNEKLFNLAVNLFKAQSEANATGIYNSEKYTTRTGKEKPLLPGFYPPRRN